ncbi:hypothetical protein EUTSA_v10029193mg [Eutrema salsugineum]|uniref:DUF8040 domain-containing protein n=1 Tax=Eutrema salsugineum TaxID=72664 RepID=V4KKD2_EUTSA|nr:hypothetical protein EUTSA_v10029193mg [Eutrema salsugineum]
MGDSRIERPIRLPVTRLRGEYIQNVLKEDPQHFRVLYRIFPDVFLKFSKTLREKVGLQDTRFISVEEMLGIFMLTVGQNSRYCYVQDTFRRSKFAISTSFNCILSAILLIAPSLMVKPNSSVPMKIRESTRFYPYFKVYYDALTRRINKFQVHEGKFYLVDCGFANQVNFLALFRGFRYHLQECISKGRDPNTAAELFNLRHASLKKCYRKDI